MCKERKILNTHISAIEKLNIKKHYYIEDYVKKRFNEFNLKTDPMNRLSAKNESNFNKFFNIKDKNYSERKESLLIEKRWIDQHSTLPPEKDTSIKLGSPMLAIQEKYSRKASKFSEFEGYNSNKRKFSNKSFLKEKSQENIMKGVCPLYDKLKANNKARNKKSYKNNLLSDGIDFALDFKK